MPRWWARWSRQASGRSRQPLQQESHNQQQRNHLLHRLFPPIDLSFVCNFREALNKLARAGSVRFFVRQKNGKQWNTVCISCFSFCVDGEKDRCPAADDLFRVSLDKTALWLVSTYLQHTQVLQQNLQAQADQNHTACNLCPLLIPTAKNAACPLHLLPKAGR